MTHNEINRATQKELEKKGMEERGYRLEEDDGKKEGVAAGKKNGRWMIWVR